VCHRVTAQGKIEKVATVTSAARRDNATASAEQSQRRRMASVSSDGTRRHRHPFDGRPENARKVLPAIGANGEKYRSVAEMGLWFWNTAVLARLAWLLLAVVLAAGAGRGCWLQKLKRRNQHARPSRVPAAQNVGGAC
jgi:hypothetical protein